jgi:hypothetical protein
MTLDCPRTKSTVHLPDDIVTNDIRVITMNEGKDIWVREPSRFNFGPVTILEWHYIEQEHILRLA